MDTHTHTYKYTYKHNELLLRHKENESVPIATPWVVLENHMLSEKTQKKITKYMTSLIYGILEVHHTREHNKKEANSQIQRTN